MSARVIGTGSYLPPFEIDNDLLCKYYPGKGAKWVEEKTGIKRRRFGFDFENNKMREGYFDDDLAEQAARRALEMAGVSPTELDLIIRITCTPEHLYFPDPACVLHKRLKASRDCIAYTIPAGCAGLVYAIKSADEQIKAGGVKRALIVASNAPSSFVNTQDPKLVDRDWLNAGIFGDGASAIVLANEETGERGILASYGGAWPENDPMKYPAGGSRYPTAAHNVYDHWYQMDVRAVRSFAPAHFRHSIKKLTEMYPCSLDEIDWFLFHQANLRILEKLCVEMRIPMNKVLINIDKYGNTSAASIGILLDEAFRSGKIKEGNLLLLAAVGAGWQYGAIFIRW